MSRGILVALAIAAFSVGANSQCQEIAGNYYCDQTDAITYNNIGFSGTYNQITSMDSSSCQCSSSPTSFSGGLAPLNDEVTRQQERTNIPDLVSFSWTNSTRSTRGLPSEWFSMDSRFVLRCSYRRTRQHCFPQ